MPMFDLLLHFSPAFERSCSIRIEGDAHHMATFEASQTGFLPRVVWSRQIDPAHSAEIRARCQSMLLGWDNRWSDHGLDGISVDGTFETSEDPARSFALWSPGKNSVPHALVSEVLACFPPDHCTGTAGELLDMLRSYFGLQPAVVVINESPLRLRLAPWLHRSHAPAVEQALNALPEEAALLVDASGVSHFGATLAAILPMAQLLERSAPVRWKARAVDVPSLVASGVADSDIECIAVPSLTEHGHPVIFGGLVVSSSELIELARKGPTIDLTRALRDEHHLTVAQAAAGSKELAALIRELDASLALPEALSVQPLPKTE